MNLILFCDDVVGEKVFDYMSTEYRDDLKLLVTSDKNKIYFKAIDKKIQCLSLDDERVLTDFLSENSLHFDLGILAWWPKIISKKILSCAAHGFINFHPSMLPYCRGKNYNFWSIVEKSPFGVSLHMVDEKIDSGDIVAQKEIKYNWTDTGETLYLKAQKSIFKLFCETYPSLREFNFKRTPQNLEKGSMHFGRELDDASIIYLDKKYTGEKLLNLLRARTFTGHPGCRFESDGDLYDVTVNIKKVEK